MTTSDATPAATPDEVPAPATATVPGGTRALLDEAARAGADCEVWTTRRVLEEVVCRAGVVERRSDVASGATAVTVWEEDAEGRREGYAVQALPFSADPSIVRTALEVGRALPHKATAPGSAGTGPAGSSGSGTGSAGADAGASGDAAAPVRPACDARLDERLVDIVRKLSESPAHQDVELRAKAERATVHLHPAGAEARQHTTGLFQLQARITTTAPSGGVGFISDQTYGTDADALLDQATRQGLPELCDLAGVLAEAPADDVDHDDVLVSGWVMVKLLSLVVPAFLQDTVVEGRSPLGEKVGQQVCARGVDLVDDPFAAAYPLSAPWDDEGTPTRTTELVVDGTLRGFLSHRHSAALAGTHSTGSGRRSAGGEMPRVQPSHLSLRPGPLIGPDPRAGRRLLRIVQANGAHTSNGITGDFSIGANAVLENPDGTRCNAGSITVAGNVFELLGSIEGHDGAVRASRSHTTFVTSPGVWTEAVAIGR